MLEPMANLQAAQCLEPNMSGPLGESGTRWAVLMLHGFTAGPQSVLPWAETLADAGATVRVPLLAGHGTRIADLAQTTAEQWRRGVQRTLDAIFAEGFDKIAVAGLSMGGTLALDAARHRPVDATLVVNPALSFKPKDQLGVFLAPLMDQIIPTVGPLAGDINKPGVTEEAYQRTPVAAVHQLARLFATTRRRLDKIESPVVLYWSPRDQIVPKSSARILRRSLAPELLTTVVLEDSFHVATLDYDAPLIYRHSIDQLLELSGDRHETS